MKSLVVLLCLVSMSASAASWKKETKAILKANKYACDNTVVTVDSIVKNESIKGHIVGLPQDAYKDFKVVTYVKTNRWYVHPFEFQNGQDEGYSYSLLKNDGSFTLKTVSRGIPSKQLVAVLVPKSYKIKSQRVFLKPFLGFIGGILKYECAHTLVNGSGDFK